MIIHQFVGNQICQKIRAAAQRTMRISIHSCADAGDYLFTSQVGRNHKIRPKKEVHLAHLQFIQSKAFTCETLENDELVPGIFF